MTENSMIPNIKACVFDAYGTLFDVHSAVGKYYERLGDVADQVSIIWRTKQLEYTRLRSLMKKHAEIVFMSANAWDAVGATAFGQKVAWINRFAQKPERLPFQPQTEIKTLAELPDLLSP